MPRSTRNNPSPGGLRPGLEATKRVRKQPAPSNKRKAEPVEEDDAPSPKRTRVSTPPPPALSEPKTPEQAAQKETNASPETAVQQINTSPARTIKRPIASPVRSVKEPKAASLPTSNHDSTPSLPTLNHSTTPSLPTLNDSTKPSLPALDNSTKPSLPALDNSITPPLPTLKRPNVPVRPRSPPISLRFGIRRPSNTPIAQGPVQSEEENIPSDPFEREAYFDRRFGRRRTRTMHPLTKEIMLTGAPPIYDESDAEEDDFKNPQDFQEYKMWQSDFKTTKKQLRHAEKELHHAKQTYLDVAGGARLPSPEQESKGPEMKTTGRKPIETLKASRKNKLRAIAEWTQRSDTNTLPSAEELISLLEAASSNETTRPRSSAPSPASELLGENQGGAGARVNQGVPGSFPNQDISQSPLTSYHQAQKDTTSESRKVTGGQVNQGVPEPVSNQQISPSAPTLGDDADDVPMSDNDSEVDANEAAPTTPNQKPAPSVPEPQSWFKTIKNVFFGKGQDASNAAATNSHQFSQPPTNLTPSTKERRMPQSERRGGTPSRRPLQMARDPQTEQARRHADKLKPVHLRGVLSEEELAELREQQDSIKQNQREAESAKLEESELRHNIMDRNRSFTVPDDSDDDDDDDDGPARVDELDGISEAQDRERIAKAQKIADADTVHDDSEQDDPFLNPLRRSRNFVFPPLSNYSVDDGYRYEIARGILYRRINPNDENEVFYNQFGEELVFRQMQGPVSETKPRYREIQYPKDAFKGDSWLKVDLYNSNPENRETDWRDVQYKWLRMGREEREWRKRTMGTWNIAEEAELMAFAKGMQIHYCKKCDVHRPLIQEWDVYSATHQLWLCSKCNSFLLPEGGTVPNSEASSGNASESSSALPNSEASSGNASESSSTLQPKQWDQTPPPKPRPSNAELPRHPAAEVALANANKYQPKKPSGLRNVTQMSPLIEHDQENMETNPERNDEDDMEADPERNELENMETDTERREREREEVHKYLATFSSAKPRGRNPQGVKSFVPPPVLLDVELPPGMPGSWEDHGSDIADEVNGAFREEEF